MENSGAKNIEAAREKNQIFRQKQNHRGNSEMFSLLIFQSVRVEKILKL